MNTHQLNLARKWRSKTFDEIVGQELSVRMLKNSLYKGLFFPVYLLSGQRGCGKTTTARVFAAAINCEKLSDFKADPRNNQLPCLACQSCCAMQQGNHPDFIEMDAASHTGVDHVRQLIDAASFLPLMGNKKIYLIDEAHMLSKAAFNALLKILEEPPRSVVFLLATTDPQKIIGTVRSRCFQMFFHPIAGPLLEKHLTFICQKEQIEYTDDGLSMIVRESDGSARDALNLLEQVRFAFKTVDKKAVIQVLGYFDDEAVYTVLEKVIEGDEESLLQYVESINIESYSAQALWHALVDMLHGVLRCSYNMKPLYHGFDVERAKQLLKQIDSAHLRSMLQILYDNELLFSKTTAQHQLLEVLLLQLCQVCTGSVITTAVQMKKIAQPEKKTVVKKKDTEIKANVTSDPSWDTFVQKACTIDDPFLVSIIKQGKFVILEDDMVTVSFPKNFSMFEDMLIQTQTLWQPILNEVFGKKIRLTPLFQDAVAVMQKREPVKRPPVTTARPTSQGWQKRSTRTPSKKTVDPNEKIIDVSDKAMWGNTNALLDAFPGTVVEIKGDKNE